MSCRLTSICGGMLGPRRPYRWAEGFEHGEPSRRIQTHVVLGVAERRLARRLEGEETTLSQRVDESRSCRGDSVQCLVSRASGGNAMEWGRGQGWLAVGGGCEEALKVPDRLFVLCVFFFSSAAQHRSLFPCCNGDSTAGGNGFCATGQYLAEIWCKDNGRTGIGCVPLGLRVPCNHPGESGPMVRSPRGAVYRLYV